MASIVEKLTAEGSGESAGFLNSTIAQLWPNINVALGNIVKETVEPILKSSLPSPLNSLHFTKIDLGKEPMRLSNVNSTPTDSGGIELDMNVDWEGKSDVELAGMGLGLGVESIHLNGRLTILLCPLTNVIPLIGAAQIAFINPPNLELDFTGAANVADFYVLDSTIRNAILGIINSVLTLPNRILVKLDTNTDYFQTYSYPLGIIRLTVEKAWGFATEAQSSTAKFFAKLTRAAPDCYVKVDVGAEERWQTSTKSNTSRPKWNETRDFIVSDFEQCIKLDVYDHDVNAADQIGIGVTTVRELLLAGKKQELPILLKGKETGGKITVSCEYFKFVPDGGSFSASNHKGDGLLCGVVTILVANARGIKGERSELKPSVVVNWGEKHRFQTVIQSDAPGTDINNPTFDTPFRIPVTTDLVGGNAENVRLTLMNGEKEMGKAEVPYQDLLNAPNMTLEKEFDVSDGATIRASIYIGGITPSTMEEVALPERKKEEPKKEESTDKAA